MIETNLAITALVLIICLLRKSLKEKVGATVLYSLWLAIPLRALLLPFVRIENPIFLFELDFRLPDMIKGVSDVGQDMCFYLIPSKLLLSIWLIGTVLLSAYYIGNGIKRERTLRLAAIKKSEGEKTFYLLPYGYYAFLMWNKVYCSKRIYENPEWRQYVWLHEQEHKHQLEWLWRFFRVVLVCIYWYNPFVWLACSLSKKDCEYACDEKVIEGLNQQERESYCHVILDIAVSMTAKKDESIYSTNAASCEVFSRIKRALSLQKPSKISKYLCYFFIAVVLVCMTGVGRKERTKKEDTKKHVITTSVREIGSYEVK